MDNVRFDGDRFNEAIADANGRVLVGTVRNGRCNGAGIYKLDGAGPLAKVLGGTGQSNGMAWNAKGDSLYWTCGTTRTICRCRYDVKRGAISNRQVFHECLPEEGVPAGLAIDMEGTLWSARRDVGAILKIGENRQLMGQVSFPALHVTSLAFGGPDRRTVFAAAIVDEGHSKIFVLQSPVAGAAVRRAKIG
jgi:sugar lactone lactonase YvrE